MDGEEVLLAGGTGMIGSRLKQMLLKQGYRVTILSRNRALCTSSPGYLYWDPSKRILDAHELSRFHYLINLAGEGIGKKRWTTKQKKRILESRLSATSLLLETLAGNPGKLRCYVGSSAIGIYGDRGDERLNEESKTGSGFLAGVCRQWEAVHNPEKSFPFRRVILRIGLVLSNRGGAWYEMRKSLRFKIAMIFGTGSQFYSWIHLDDLCRMILAVLQDAGLHGVYNAVAPLPVTSRQFAAGLAMAGGGRHLFLKIPAPLMRILLGERASILLEGQYVRPDRFLAAGFRFSYPDCLSALKSLLA